METPHYNWTLIVAFFLACLPLACLTKALGEAAPSSGDPTKSQFGDKDDKFLYPHAKGDEGFQSWDNWWAKRGFGENPFADGNLQSWKGWMEKRGFGENPFADRNFQSWKGWMDKRRFGENPFSDGNLQSWKGWMDKRRFGENPFADGNLQSWKGWMDKRGGFMRPAGNSPAFGGGLTNAQPFQQWRDWMEKRGFTGSATHIPFSGNNGQFQTWDDWVAKRGFGAGLANEGGLGNGAGDVFGQNAAAGKFQSWADFTKKANFGADPDFSGLGQMYQKRFGSAGPSNPFSVPFGANTDLMSWSDWAKRTPAKRQLGSRTPTGFGQHNQFFTKGLQDWRSTYQKSKRAQSNANPSKQEKH